MAELITMPKLGFDMAEGTLQDWLKHENDVVSEGEIIAVIETDKASVEVPSFRSGVLLKVLVEAGTSVPIGTPIAVIGNQGETLDMAELGLGSEAAGKVEARPKAVEEPSAAAPAVPTEEQGEEVPEGGRLLASPVAARMAAELGIDLRHVKGSGPGGRIIKRDIEARLLEREKAPEKPAKLPIVTPASAPTSESYEVEPLSPMRQTIGRRMTESKQQAPHFYVTMEIDMSAAMALRRQVNALLPEGEKVSINDLIIKATAVALVQFPKLNSSFAGNEIHLHNQINIGLAVARENGLLTTVVRDSDKKSVVQIAREARDLAGRAREGRMKPDDMVGGTFTISNLGMFDVDDFVAIINPPQAAILAVGAVRRVPVVAEDGGLVVGERMKITISADHRVTDGAEAAKFLQVVRAALESPLRLMI